MPFFFKPEICPKMKNRKKKRERKSIAEDIYVICLNMIILQAIEYQLHLHVCHQTSIIRILAGL